MAICSRSRRHSFRKAWRLSPAGMNAKCPSPTTTPLSCLPKKKMSVSRIYLLTDIFFFGKQLNGVVVGLGHFASIPAGDSRHAFRNECLRDREQIAICVVKVLRDIPRYFYMLFLVLSDRNPFGGNDQDV